MIGSRERPLKERTKRSLNSCVEQEKCFSLSYEKVDDWIGDCRESNCGYKWKVCINVNRNNPCCTKRLNSRPKRAFKRACIRGSEIDYCLTDDVSLDAIKRLRNVEFNDTICEVVRPGDNALFQLVSLFTTWATREHDLPVSGSPVDLLFSCLFPPSEMLQ